MEGSCTSRNLSHLSFFDRQYLTTAEAGDINFHKKSSRAVAFNDLLDGIEEMVDTNEDVYRPAQTVKLLETCDVNVEINNRIIAWKQKPKYKINGAASSTG